jgi:Putative peptidoglycan binding domain
MKGTTAAVLATLAVLYSLIVLLFADRSSPSGPAFVTDRERMSDAGFGLIQTLQRRRQSPQDHTSNVDRIMKIQQALKNDGFYSGPVDGIMRQSTRQAMRSFQKSNNLKVTGTVDDETAHELGLR